MRHIKFRTWFDGEMIPVHNLEIEDDGGTTTNFSYINCPLMQFTGLTDRNDKEIYEGDILAPVRNTGYKETPQGLLCQVVWDEDWVTFKGLKDNKRDGEYVLTRGNATKHWEVIGNIYESPELLTNK